MTNYALALLEGLRATGRAADVLLDVPPDVALGGSRQIGHLRRWLRAAWPAACRAAAIATPPAGFAHAWLAPDVFRLAQVHFDIHGNLLEVRSRQPPALMHWTYPLPLVFRNVPNVYTVHDLIPMRTPNLTDIDSRRFARIIRAVARRADHVVTVSEASRRDIMTLLGLPQERVTNTYQPLNLPPGLDDAPPPDRRGHFLFCGAIEPRKNIGRLIAAYRESAAVAPLILAGPDGWRAAEELAAGGAEIRPLSELAGTAPEHRGVWRAPWLPRPALLDLLRGARALLFPSLAEGFGLPIAEAMALGVPVLTSGGGATEEIAGDAALLVNPLDIRAMAEAIACLDRDTELCERLAAAGRRRSAAFSPAACFGRLAAIYDRLGVART
ncbi:glycosyltransferase family 4 protein [Rhodopila sp.]|uniref:glycosyltransferase family 4 protein n=1 Tax=Rhodopila sp. TaxID=2480087 RepID=UPI003D12CD8D